MESLVIEGTQKTPTVIFEPNGYLQLKGRMLLENATKTFEPLIAWIEELECNDIIFDIDLDYLNTSASMQLFSLMRLLDENCDYKSIIVNWYYEEDDEDHLDMGYFFRDNLSRTKFEFLAVSEDRLVA